MNQNLIDIALMFYDLGSFKDKTHPDAQEFNGARGYRLKLHEKSPEAPPSPFFFNLRTPDNPKAGPLTPEVVADCANAFDDTFLKDLSGSCNVVGVPNAGEPFAHALMCVLRSHEIKAHLLRLQKSMSTRGRQIVGPVNGNRSSSQKVILLDDLITKADSKLEAVDVLHENGFEVMGVYVILDRQQGGMEELRSHSLTCGALFTLEEILDCYVENDRITSQLREEIVTYARGA